MAWVVPNTFTAGTIVDPAAQNTNWTSVAAKINGGIGNTEFNSADPLATSNLAAPNFHVQVALRFKANPMGWPNVSVQPLDYVPMPSSASPQWVPANGWWICGDCGSDAATFQVVWGYFLNGAWTTTTNITAATTIATYTGAATANVSGNQGTVTTLSTSALTYPNTYMAFALMSTSAPQNTVCCNYDLVVVIDVKSNITT